MSPLDLGHLPIAAWIAHWGYLAVGVGVMAESAGIPLPGETILVLATIASAHGSLHPLGIFVAAVTGAVVGDNAGYWVGREVGPALLRRLGRLWGWNEAKVAAAQAEFCRRGPYAVFFGRFVALLRTLAGPMAGVSHMHWRTFFLCNLGGAILWVAVIESLSYAFGAAIVEHLHHAGVLLAVLVAIALAIVWWRHRGGDAG